MRIRNHNASKPIAFIVPLDHEDGSSKSSIGSAEEYTFARILQKSQHDRKLKRKILGNDNTLDAAKSKTNLRHESKIQIKKVSFAKKVSITEFTIEYDVSQVDKEYPICLGVPCKKTVMSLKNHHKNNNGNTKKKNDVAKKLSVAERKEMLLSRGGLSCYSNEGIVLTGFERERKMVWARQRIQAKRDSSIAIDAKV